MADEKPVRRSDWFEETSPEALAVYTELHRAMPLSQKLARIFELMDIGQQMVRDRIRREYPGASEREVFLRVAATRLDRQSMIAVYGWDPEPHP